MTDRSTVLAVVYLLGALALVALGGVIFLLERGRPAGEIAVVTSLASTPTGALAALLASTRSSPPQPPEPPGQVAP